MQGSQALSKKMRTICVVNWLPNIMKHCRDATYVSGMTGSGIFICRVCSYIHYSRKGTDGRGRDLH